MIKALQNIVDDINEKAEHVQMSFSEDKWLEKIPSKPGWYLIKTDAPINILSDDKLLRPRYKAHINIPKTIKETLQLRDIAIIQSGNKQYVIYSGEAKSLRARAREHIKGHEKTYCLGLNAYDSLKEHDWIFCYVTLSNYPNFLNLNGDNKLLRLAVEQAWRAKNGWPILCKK